MLLIFCKPVQFALYIENDTPFYGLKPYAHDEQTRSFSCKRYSIKFVKRSNALAAATQAFTLSSMHCGIPTRMATDNDRSATRVAYFCEKTKIFEHILVFLVSTDLNNNTHGMRGHRYMKLLTSGQDLRSRLKFGTVLGIDFFY